MYRIILFFVVIVTSSLLTSSIAQTIWNTTFDIPDKGVWISSEGTIIVDTAGVDWALDYEDASFAEEGDYARSVTTSGGRFEVLDSDGTIRWKSPLLDVSSYEYVNIELRAAETGSSTNVEKKFIQPKVLVDGTVISFSDSIVKGNWGEKSFQEIFKVGNNLQLIVEMNSSYANDKIYIDDVVIEVVDPIFLEPTGIRLSAFENVVIHADTFLVAAEILNGYGQVLYDEDFKLELDGSNLEIFDYAFSEGRYNWKILANELGVTSIKICPTNFESDTIYQTFYVVDDSAILGKNNFEQYTLDDTVSEWEIIPTEPLQGFYSLKHTEAEESGFSRYIISNAEINGKSGHYQFGWSIKNGDWNPSSSNNFHIELKGENGTYAFGVNLSGSTDLFSMWKLKNHAPPVLLAETDFQWTENVFAKVEIFRSAIGCWTIVLRDEQNLIIGRTHVNDHEFSTFSELALIFEYTKTRSGQLWFDDFEMLKVNIPPTIISVKSLMQGTILVQLNEPIDTSKFNIENISMSSGTHECFIQAAKFINSTSLRIEFVPREDLYYSIEINSLFDIAGEEAKNLNFTFKHILAPFPLEIVINEIMADPTPSKGLPEVEYIELYNCSNHYLKLDEAQIVINNKTKPLPDSILAPFSYSIVCDVDDTTTFDSRGDLIPVASLPALLNAGTSITLSCRGETIDSVCYGDDWYKKSIKSIGGFSLEKIDPNRNCGNINNWSASIDLRGGTPGFENSIFMKNVDLVAPTILSLELLSAQKIRIEFSESVDTTLSLEFSIQPSTNIESFSFDNSCHFITIEFAKSIIEDEEYFLQVDEIIDECGNIGIDLSASFVWHHVEKGDLFISEILFNPIGDGADFFELFNASPWNIDLFKLHVATRDDSMQLKSVYSLAKHSQQVESGSYFVFTKDSQDIVDLFNMKNPNQIVEVDKMPAFNNAHGILVLLNDSLEVIDEFEYDETMHSKFISDNEGVSLERISFSEPTNIAENWFSGSSISNYATPGFASDCADLKTFVSVELNTEVVSPNFDNFNDELILTFILNRDSYLANIFVFDAAGKMENQVMNNDLVVNNDQYILPLETKTGNKLKTGVHFIVAELISEFGDQHQIRKSFYVKN